MKKLIPLLILLFVTACSSIKKADIPPTANPQDEIVKLETDINNAIAQQHDLLAADEIRRSKDYLENAKEGVAEGQRQERVLDDLRYARAYFERAEALAEKRKTAAESILQVRQAALNAGAKNFPTQREQLEKIDRKVRAESDDLNKNLSPGEFSNIQEGYMGIELGAIQSTHLGEARAKVTGAEDKNANRYTPKILAQARKSLTTGLNAIAADRHNPESFQDEVQRAKYDVTLLAAILDATDQGGNRVNEATATRIALADQQIKDLHTQLSEVQETVGTQGRMIGQSQQALQSASSRLSLQEAIDSAREDFTSEEAEAFQQGEKLLLRLKAMNFASGQSELPQESLALLAKVRDITARLNPSEIVVSGHTDSTGGPRINQRLSRERAQAVARYLETNGLDQVSVKIEGWGFTKPIASNRTREGRAQNRRVDVVVTPGPDVDMMRATEPEGSAQENF